MYNTTAFLYDATAAFEEPEKVCKDIHDILHRCGIHPPGILGDLGAGTGLMSILFAERGWCIYGVELSHAMLAAAQAKITQLPEPVQKRLTWTHGDITVFELPSDLQLDGAVCLCNTINHLVTWSQVEGFIRSAFRALKPGGVLILDSDALGTFMGFFHHGPIIVWDDGLHQMIRTCEFDTDTGIARHIATLAQYTSDDLQVINEEAMQLRYHAEADLHAAFLASGFRLEDIRPYNPCPKLYQGDFIPKVLWTLRKPE